MAADKISLRKLNYLKYLDTMQRGLNETVNDHV